MRVRIELDSITAEEVRTATFAFQRHGTEATRPPDLAPYAPTLRAVGTAFTWTSPWLHATEALVIMSEIDNPSDTAGCSCGMADLGAPGHDHA